MGRPLVDAMTLETFPDLTSDTCEFKGHSVVLVPSTPDLYMHSAGLTLSPADVGYSQRSAMSTLSPPHCHLPIEVTSLTRSLAVWAGLRHSLLLP